MTTATTAATATILPNLVMMRMDETSHYETPFLKKHGIARVWGNYLYDTTRIAYACELTPSYCCHTLPDTAEYLPGATEDMITDAEAEFANPDNIDTDPIRYYHCKEIDALPAEQKKPCVCDADDLEDAAKDDKSYEKLIQEMLGECNAFGW